MPGILTKHGNLFRTFPPKPLMAMEMGKVGVSAYFSSKPEARISAKSRILTSCSLL